MEPSWFAVIAWIALALGFASALAMLRYPQEMPVMRIVHPITALYWGPAWPWAYRRGRLGDSVLAVSHCGAGCTLGDICGEWLLFAVGVNAFGWELAVDFALAWSFGIAFQYFSSEGGVWHAIKIDTLSIVAFQVGLFGWMALSHYVLFQPPLPVNTSGHWFLMQIGMIIGFFTAWPVNAWLIRSGVKKPMG